VGVAVVVLQTGAGNDVGQQVRGGDEGVSAGVEDGGVELVDVDVAGGAARGVVGVWEKQVQSRLRRVFPPGHVLRYLYPQSAHVIRPVRW
jgi:hypothetical protein